jgi:hypothetical protein
MIDHVPNPTAGGSYSYENGELKQIEQPTKPKRNKSDPVPLKAVATPKPSPAQPAARKE